MRYLNKQSWIRTRTAWGVGKARWLIGLVLAALGMVGTLLGVPDLGAQVRTELPGIRCWWPVPMDDARFTVAMSPFITVENGRARTAADGRELARVLFTRLESSFAELNLGVPYELRGPDQTCPVVGADRENRAAAAETMAATLQADVVIYGAIVVDGAESELQPEFYVAYRGFDEAADLIGPHELGRPLRVAVPVHAQDMEGIADHPVNARAQALSLVALGLASYAVDDFDRAFDYFLEAEQIPNWPESAGKELVYLLLGNTASNLAATTLDDLYVDEALDYFDQALDIAPGFARAQIGKAAATYQLALGDLQTRRGSQVDTTLLDEAEALYRAAAEADAPAAAEIPLKVHFGLGQIFLVRHYLQVAGGDWLEQARAEFQALVDAYTAGGVRNVDLAGHGYARLGLIAAQIDQEPDAAVDDYTEAIALVSPRWQAQYELDLGDVLAGQGDTAGAREHFEAARDVAELYGNEAMVSRAEDRLAAIPE
jgi:tetratricopeptide (TPR) repeat protein